MRVIRGRGIYSCASHVRSPFVEVATEPTHCRTGNSLAPSGLTLTCHVALGPHTLPTSRVEQTHTIIDHRIVLALISLTYDILFLLLPFPCTRELTLPCRCLHFLQSRTSETVTSSSSSLRVQDESQCSDGYDENTQHDCMISKR